MGKRADRTGQLVTLLVRKDLNWSTELVNLPLTGQLVNWSFEAMHVPRGETNMARKPLPALDAYCDDCVMPGEPVLSDQEKAYRRGFHQGAWTAMNAIREGVPLHKVGAWLNRLHAWRLKGHLWLRGAKVKPVFPPAAPDHSKQKTPGT